MKDYSKRDKKIHKRKYGHLMDGKGLKRVLLDLYYRKKGKNANKES